MNELRVGLIGCGRHGQRYLRHLAAGDVEGMRPVALWRRDAHAAAMLADEFGIEAAASLEELLDPDRCDAVLILTPPGPHADQLRAATRAGLWTLVEKPMVAGWEQARELVAGLDTSRVMVAQTLRFTPVLQEVAGIVAGLGPVHRIRIAQRLAPSDLQWQRDPAIAGGGSVLLTGVHLFDLLRWLVGRTPDAVQARMHAVQGFPTENVFDACFEYEDRPLLASTEVSKFTRSRSGLLELVGEAGQLQVDYLRGRIELVEGAAREVLLETGEVPTLPLTLACFGAWIRGEMPCPVSFHDGFETVRMAEACYRSHASGRRVRLQELDHEPRNGNDANADA